MVSSTLGKIIEDNINSFDCNTITIRDGIKQSVSNIFNEHYSEIESQAITQIQGLEPLYYPFATICVCIPLNSRELRWFEQMMVEYNRIVKDCIKEYFEQQEMECKSMCFENDCILIYLRWERKYTRCGYDRIT